MNETFVFLTNMVGSIFNFILQFYDKFDYTTLQIFVGIRGRAAYNGVALPISCMS